MLYFDCIVYYWPVESVGRCAPRLSPFENSRPDRPRVTAEEGDTSAISEQAQQLKYPCSPLLKPGEPSGERTGEPSGERPREPSGDQQCRLRHLPT